MRGLCRVINFAKLRLDTGIGVWYDDFMNETICEAICDAIDSGEISLPDALAYLEIARRDDTSESAHAAHIRDCIRDNHETDI